MGMLWTLDIHAKHRKRQAHGMPWSGDKGSICWCALCRMQCMAIEPDSCRREYIPLH